MVVCQSVCHVSFTVRGSFGAAFAKLLWLLVNILTWGIINFVMVEVEI